MTIRLPVLLTGLLLAAGLHFGLGEWREAQRGALVGLSDNPCAPDGTVITGRPSDDWAARCFYRAQNVALMASGRRPEVVMIGDSLTMGWPVMEGVVDRGIGLQTSDQIMLRFREDVVQLSPRVVHILVGINDVAGITGPVTLEQYRGNLTAMIEMAQANGITVIIGTVPSARSFPLNPAITPGPAVTRLNGVVHSLADDYGLVLADYNAVMSLPDGSIRAQNYIDDGVHPGPAGYAAMQPVFDAALRQARANLPAQVSGSR
jgi:lysophospholipase L1-like esterase